MLHFLLCHKLSSRFSLKPCLVITLLVLKLHRSTAFRSRGQGVGNLILYHPLPPPLDTSPPTGWGVVVGILIPRLPKAVRPGPHLPWPLGSTGNGWAAVGCLPHRDQFSALFQLPSPQEAGIPYSASFSLLFLIVLCLFTVNSHDSFVDDLKILTFSPDLISKP